MIHCEITHYANLHWIIIGDHVNVYVNVGGIILVMEPTSKHSKS